MKIIFYCGLGACLFLSCTNDGDGIAAIQSSTTSLYAAKTKTVTTTNPANPQDQVGTIYSVLYEGYFPDSTRVLYGTLPDITDYASGEEPFGQLDANNNLPSDSAILETIITTAASNPELAFSYSALTPNGLASLLGITTILSQMYESDAPYQQVYDAIVSYEGEVVSDPQLSTTDRNILLTSMAVVRQDATGRKPRKRKDRDWEFSIGHVAATAYGASESDVSAVLYGLGATFE